MRAKKAITKIFINIIIIKWNQSKNSLILLFSRLELPEIKISKKDFKLREDIHFMNHGSYGACPKVMLEE
jgi:hypothetical protein